MRYMFMIIGVNGGKIFFSEPFDLTVILLWNNEDMLEHNLYGICTCAYVCCVTCIVNDE